MAKRPLKLSIRIPPYETPRNQWRKKLHQAVSKALRAQRKQTVSYNGNDKLEVQVRLYLKKNALFVHDIDNRLKDILDALQGRAGGPKSKRTLVPIIPNDRQIYRVIVEKSASPKQSRGLGHLTIRKFRTWKFVRLLPPKKRNPSLRQ